MKNIYSILSFCLLLITVSVVGQTKIYAPNLRAPENMEVDQMPDVIIDWDAVTGITLDITYELQLASNIDFTDAVSYPGITVTAKTMSSLVFGSTYFWRVRANDSGEISGWSEVWSFSVVGNVSGLNPKNGEEVYSNPFILWDQLSGVSGYVLQVDTVSAWNFVESPVTSDCFATYIVSENNMWVGGASGLLLNNIGDGWITIESGTTKDINDLFFIDESNGYAVGNAGLVLFYDGISWTSVDVGTTEDLLALSFSSANSGVVVGANGTVVIYNEGTWEIKTTGDNNTLYDVDMLNADNIWACGSGNIVVNYDGDSWFANEVGSKDHYGIAMIDENSGWIVGKSGKIFGWNGDSWFEITSGTSKHLNSVSFVDGVGVAVGASGTMLTYDGAWVVDAKLIGDDYNAVMLLGDVGFVVGESGVFVNKDGNGFDSPFLKVYNISSDSSSWPLNNLFFGQEYFYRILAFHNADSSCWSGTQSFITYSSPELDSPSNSTVNDLLVKF